MNSAANAIATASLVAEYNRTKFASQVEARRARITSAPFSPIRRAELRVMIACLGDPSALGAALDHLRKYRVKRENMDTRDQLAYRAEFVAKNGSAIANGTLFNSDFILDLGCLEEP